MAGTLAIVALVVSALLLGTMILALVLLRKGEGPTYSASQAYDTHRREALRTLTGVEVAAVPADQWYDPAFERPGAGTDLIAELREAVRDALRAIVPNEAGLWFDEAGLPRLEDAGARVVPSVSTAAFREDPDAKSTGEGESMIGLVLFNPEPPGGEASRVTLPVQALFPVLEREGRHDLIRRFEALRDAASNRTTHPGGAPT